MAIKSIGYYWEEFIQNPNAADTIYFQIDQWELILMAYSQSYQKLMGIEHFKLELKDENWERSIQDSIEKSNFAKNHFQHQIGYFNFPEAVLIPLEHFSNSSAEDYLNLQFGESMNCFLKFQKIERANPLVIAYRIPKALQKSINQHFVLYQSNHLFANLISNTNPECPFIDIRFFQNHAVLSLNINGEIQIIKDITFENQASILYHLVNLCQQFSLDKSTTCLQVSGNIELEDSISNALSIFFNKIEFEPASHNYLFSQATNYSNYFFTPSCKLLP